MSDERDPREVIDATWRRGARLDVPREARRTLVPRPHVDPDAFGKFAEGFARFMGTAKFLAYMTIFIIVWVIINVVGVYRLKWDPYPFILLNLIFSTQASYAAPLILLAQNRQDDRDRVTVEQDRQRAERNLADTEYLAREVAALRIAMREVATRDFLRSELRGLLEDLESNRDGGRDANRDDRPEPRRPDTRRPEASRSEGRRRDDRKDDATESATPRGRSRQPRTRSGT